jgi:hypothetical protein
MRLVGPASPPREMLFVPLTLTETHKQTSAGWAPQVRRTGRCNATMAYFGGRSDGKAHALPNAKQQVGPLRPLTFAEARRRALCNAADEPSSSYRRRTPQLWPTSRTRTRRPISENTGSEPALWTPAGIDGSYFACVASDGVEEAKHGGAEAAALPFLRAALSFWVAHSRSCKWESPGERCPERSKECSRRSV